ncbi:uncharacterized phosphotransferase YvkC-like [Oppia nitens]|uniref:uncharacterized phosphotransferase YvkC-like n=1 Tax=Oppia nitens TaxID=1686743 RepID=UPI0023DC5A31|nr:uncharacterized phosphotransferase YvkC-like [Oppia nitens]
MGALISLPILAYLNSILKLHQQINGQWIRYLRALIGLRLGRRQRSGHRIHVHNPLNPNPWDAGILPFSHEWQYDLPAQNKCEDILIYGVNSSKQSIYISIKWRPNGKINHKINATINLRIEDNINVYTLDETQEVEYRKGEYRVSGLGLEIQVPFKRKRIKFRGYLLKNNKELVYIQFRFLWYACSRVYDFTSDFDDYFMAKELTLLSSKLPKSVNQFEDRFEQFGQIKGTFREEKQLESNNLYFWGTISKKYLMSKTKDESFNRHIIRVNGYTKTGIGFQLGLITINNQITYRFGFLFEQFGGFKKLNDISLLKSDFHKLISESKLKFTATFNNKLYNFEVKPNNGLAKQLVINGSDGMCIISEENDIEFESLVKVVKEDNELAFVLGLNEEKAKRVDLSGGKGSSLAVLTSLAKTIAEDNNSDHKFVVPNGVVVTTNAYQKLLDDNEDLCRQILELEKSTQLTTKEFENKCNLMVKTITSHCLPEIIKQEIKAKLKTNFNSIENNLFAVRSSGASEDSEEMSAAGQMTTFLGIKGLDNIYEAVMKCWASQFDFVAVQYKRGYGQPIDSPMAVVIQEMIACESAGVMFTCDPITGDERVIEVTANYGLGESVVSASADPDTIKLSVNIECNSLSKPRNIRSIESKVIGAKKSSIRLSESGGTVEEEINDNTNCCVSDDVLYRLGDLALIIHKHYGNARDIEWGLKGGEIFMLQSRPVTNLDNSYTDYEIMHELDTVHPTEFEIYSRAHWGENYPGYSSPLVFTYLWANKGSSFDFSLPIDDYNPYVDFMGVCYNQLFFNLTNSAFDRFNDYPDGKLAEYSVLAFFGHHIDDKDLLNLFKSKAEAMTRPTLWQTIRDYANIFLFGKKTMFDSIDKYYGKYDYVEPLRRCRSGGGGAKQVFSALMDQFHMLDEQFFNHSWATPGSTIKNGALRYILETAQKNNPNLDSDFNLMIFSCDEVVSAEVPNILRDIAQTINNKQQFVQLSDNEALKMLSEGTDKASVKFKEFLKTHGHRGYKEMDPMCKTWVDDPIPCIKNIKGLLLGDESQLKPKVSKSIDQVMNELKTPLSLWRRYLISKVLLPWARKGVGYREISKNYMVWLNHQLRRGFQYMAQTMVSDGLIPSTETFFLLTIDEIDTLCNGNRDPMILTKARLRKRLVPQMNRYKFDEIIKGPEMEPKNLKTSVDTTSSLVGNNLLKMSGTPVSVGTVRARVCVAEDMSDADKIQSGDILITYSTDIGWSPYFPLLSGIVTEIGGTISHGAVIAREYGIPSLIAVDNACRAFKTGDICVLDTQSATITKVE